MNELVMIMIFGIWEQDFLHYLKKESMPDKRTKST